MERKMFYWIALLVASCLAGCRSHSGETDMQTRMRTEIVTNVRDSVLPFWMDYAVAPDGGFYGTVLRNGTPVVDAPRGGVLNARILWSFSAAYRTFGDESYLKLANKSQRYFIDTFIDKKNGGVYWLVNPDGEVVNAYKACYACNRYFHDSFPPSSSISSAILSHEYFRASALILI